MNRTGKWTMVPLVATKYHSYLNLVNNFLFTMYNKTYYVYKINESDTSVLPSTFVIDRSVGGPLFKFRPYSVDITRNLIYVMLRTSIGFRVINYTWSQNSELNPNKATIIDPASTYKLIEI